MLQPIEIRKKSREVIDLYMAFPISYNNIIRHIQDAVCFT